MADIRVERSGNRTTITLSGELTVLSVVEIKRAMGAELRSAPAVMIALENASEADVAFLQLLCAAHRTAITTGKQMAVTGVEQQAFRQTALRGGFRRHVGCSEDSGKSCFLIG